MNSKEFKKYLDKAKKVVEKNNSYSILDNIMFNDGVFTVSDLEVYYSFKNDCMKSVTALVNFQMLHKVFTKLKNTEFEFVSNESQFIIRTPKGDFNLKNEGNISDYPQPVETELKIGAIKNEHLSLIKKAINYVATDELRSTMMCVNIENEHIVASDAHILCFYKHSGVFEGDESAMLRIKAAKTLDFEGHIFSNVDRNYLRVSSGIETLIQKSVDGSYPNWKAVIPENDKTMSLKSDELLEKLELAKITGNSGSELVKLSVNGDVTISSQDIDFDSSYISKIESAKTDGSKIEIGFKNSFLQNILKTEKTEKSTFKFSDASRAAIINDNCIITPMMLEY